MSASVHARIHTPPGQTPPCQQTDTAADGTHPTGMHSCLIYFISFEKDFLVLFACFTRIVQFAGEVKLMETLQE